MHRLEEVTHQLTNAGWIAMTLESFLWMIGIVCVEFEDAQASWKWQSWEGANSYRPGSLSPSWPVEAFQRVAEKVTMMEGWQKQRQAGRRRVTSTRNTACLSVLRGFGVFGKSGNGTHCGGNLHHIFLPERGLLWDGVTNQRADSHGTRGLRDASGLLSLVRSCVCDLPRFRLGRTEGWKSQAGFKAE